MEKESIKITDIPLTRYLVTCRFCENQYSIQIEHKTRNKTEEVTKAIEISEGWCGECYDANS